MGQDGLDMQADALIRLALSEDLGTGDVTAKGCIPEDLLWQGEVLAKEALVLAGMPYFARVFELLDPRVACESLVPEGEEVAPKTVVAKLKGPARSILMGERTALNILQRLSGVASETRAWVKALAPYKTEVVDTRKTSPGMRGMQKYAVRQGGGRNHRMGLDSGILIKDNHISACGSLTETILRCRQQAPHVLKIEVEVEDMAMVKEAVEAEADIILLDNMTPLQMAEAVAYIREKDARILTEASGGLSLENAEAVAKTGVDFVSVGALTHSARARDLSLML